MSNDAWRAAIHEAAHCVACWALDISLEQVELYQRGGGTTRAHLFANTKSPTSYEEAHRGLVVLAAGAAAERHLFGAAEISGEDEKSIDALFAPINLEPEVERAWRKRARRDARKLVRSNWKRVEGIAGALMQRGAIAGDDIMRLLGPNRVVSTNNSDIRYRHDGKIAGKSSAREAVLEKEISGAEFFDVVTDVNKLLGQVRIKRSGAFEALRDGVSLGTFATMAEAARAV
jgi:hypothetical protein